MTLAEIKKIQDTSKAKKGPWVSYWDEMARKSIVKRGSKYWPKVDRLDNAIHNLNEDVVEGLELEPVMPVITAEEYQQAQVNLMNEANFKLEESIDAMNISLDLKSLECEFTNIWRYLKTNELFKGLIVTAVAHKDINKTRLEADNAAL